MKIAVASFNPVKVNAARQGFEAVFAPTQIEIISTAGGPNTKQPMTDNETLECAYRRLDYCTANATDVDFYVAHEGGVNRDHVGQMETFCWVLILDNNGKIGRARTCSLVVPSKVAALVDSGMELGKADDIVFGVSNSKQVNGAVGILTNNIITRTSLYSDATVLALIPFMNPELY